MITLYGLWFAWNRNTNEALRRRIARLADFVANRTKHVLAHVFPHLRRDAVVVATAADSWAMAHNATVITNRLSTRPPRQRPKSNSSQDKSLHLATTSRRCVSELISLSAARSQADHAETVAAQAIAALLAPGVPAQRIIRTSTGPVRTVCDVNAISLRADQVEIAYLLERDTGNRTSSR
ncbi:hypothetical protein OHB12_05095 [Nocardia sp. NBC_01730]|uniref:hypothetical protein n=1 Tax=Nocardia sp. NBC_01730 TaxID=2975998 RepID=UPI002E0F917E|nr:hypothetical protein OHB12_05095 [Nocardia sp. NBC_01730]